MYRITLCAIVGLCACLVFHGSECEASTIEAAYDDLVALAWYLQFEYVRVGEYPPTLEGISLSGEQDDVRHDVRDPFSPLLLPYGYEVLDDGESFVLYSVGPDGIDDGGRVLYAFWPGGDRGVSWSHLGPAEAPRGDLMLDSRNLSLCRTGVLRRGLLHEKPLLFEYAGGDELMDVTAAFIEERQQELEHINAPTVLESDKETYQETLQRFCLKEGIRVLAEVPAPPDAALQTQGNVVNDALSRLHGPIPQIKGGRYEILTRLAHACGLRVVSAAARSARKPGKELQLVAGDHGDSDDGNEENPALVIEPFWQALGDAEQVFRLSALFDDLDACDRLAEVCKGLGYVDSGDKQITVWAPWFARLLGLTDLVVGPRDTELSP